MSTRPQYMAILDALGLYVERAGGSDVLVNELSDGYLLAFVDRAGQQVVTFDDTEIAQLLQEAARQNPKGGWLRRRDDALSGPRARLRALGQYLDGRTAAAIVVQERANGYSVEFTGVPSRTDDIYEITRLHETFDEQGLQALL